MVTDETQGEAVKAQPGDNTVPAAADCQHSWGPATDYLVVQIDDKARVFRKDTRSRQTCETCGKVETVLLKVEHVGGLVL